MMTSVKQRIFWVELIEIVGYCQEDPRAALLVKSVVELILWQLALERWFLSSSSLLPPSWPSS